MLCDLCHLFGNVWRVLATSVVILGALCHVGSAFVVL